MGAITAPNVASPFPGIDSSSPAARGPSRPATAFPQGCQTKFFSISSGRSEAGGCRMKKAGFRDFPRRALRRARSCTQRQRSQKEKGKRLQPDSPLSESRTRRETDPENEESGLPGSSLRGADRRDDPENGECETPEVGKKRVKIVRGEKDASSIRSLENDSTEKKSFLLPLDYAKKNRVDTEY